MRNKKEFEMQRDFVNYISLAYPKLLFTISPAGFITSTGLAMKAKAMGYRAGTPDILIFEPIADWHGLFIEFKAPGGRIQPNQEEFIALALDRKYACAFCFSVERALEVLGEYLSRKV